MPSSEIERRAENCLTELYNFEKERADRRKDKKFSLDRAQEALHRFGYPEENFKIIHIAGTKGKGSVANHLAKLLRDEGLKTGLFTSPHLETIRERIQVNGRMIAPEDMIELAKRVTEPKGKPQKLSIFEAMFVMSMMYFQQQKTDVAILETGLGGRLDATNSVRADLSVLTRIDYDHVEILGDTLEKIAAEKAAIIKEGVPVVALSQQAVVESVFRAYAEQKGAELTLTAPAEGRPKEIPESSWENASLTRRVYELFLSKPCPLSVAQITEITIPGRRQKLVWRGSEYLFDVAHNRLSLCDLAKSLYKLPQPVSMLFAMSDDRKPEELLGEILPFVSRANFVRLPGSPRGVPEQELYRIARKIIPQKDIGCLPLRQWLNLAEVGTRLVTGSFYLVGEILKMIREAGEGKIAIFPQEAGVSTEPDDPQR